MDVNEWTLSGRLTKDPDYREVGEKATPLVKFTLASNDRSVFKGDTVFVDVEVWGAPAKIVHTYSCKGAELCASGSYAVNKWEDKEGQTRYKHFMKAEKIRLGRKPEAHKTLQEVAPVAEEDIPF